MSLFSLLGEGTFFPDMDPRCLCRVPVFRLGDSREHIRKVCGDVVFERSGPIWGFDAEGELNGVWRDLGVEGLWSMLGTSLARPCSMFFYSALVKWSAGNLMLSRFHSKHVALRKWFFRVLAWFLSDPHGLVQKSKRWKRECSRGGTVLLTIE